MVLLFFKKCIQGYNNNSNNNNNDDDDDDDDDDIGLDIKTFFNKRI